MDLRVMYKNYTATCTEGNHGKPNTYHIGGLNNNK